MRFEMFAFFTPCVLETDALLWSAGVVVSIVTVVVVVDNNRQYNTRGDRL